MRLFLAINLAPAVREQVADAAAPLREIAPRLRWSKPDRIHLTLKFLDDQPESVVPRLSDAMDAAVQKHFSFDMRLGGEHAFGAFPNFRRARVVWMGVEHDPRLELLHHDVELACEVHGFPIEGRPFRPHITLARVGDKLDAKTARALDRAAKKMTFDGEAPVTSVDLMQSVRSTEAVYQLMHSSPLRAR